MDIGAEADDFSEFLVVCEFEGAHVGTLGLLEPVLHLLAYLPALHFGKCLPPPEQEDDFVHCLRWDVLLLSSSRLISERVQ